MIDICGTIHGRRNEMKPTCPKLGNYFGYGSEIIVNRKISFDCKANVKTVAQR